MQLNLLSEWLCHESKEGKTFYRKRGNNSSLIRKVPFIGVREKKTFNTHPEDTYDGWNEYMLSLLLKKEENIIHIITTLYNIYSSYYVFPDWVKEPKELQKLNWADTVVYYNSDDNITKVIKIATEREPVNIAMSRQYDKEALEKLAGYKTGAYGESTPDCLMPNIAIYCITPIVYGNKRIDKVHVINLIGYAFDNKKQPDVAYFVKNNILDTDKLQLAYAKVWVYAFVAAFQHNLTQIQVFGVGAGAFRPDSIGEQTFLKNYVDDAINIAREMVPEYSKNITVKRDDSFFIPNGLFDISEEEVLSTLYVNAWDPWSMVGNGNKGDKSLDGYWGRSSAMVPLCWPKINSEISYEPVNMKNL